MKRSLSAFLAALVPCLSLAGPTLSAGPYDASTGIPTTVTLTVDGVPAKVACTLASSPNGTTASCDLSTLTMPGSHTLVLVASNTTADCTPDGTTPPNWDCTSGGSSSYGPFTWTQRAGSATTRAVKLVP